MAQMSNQDPESIMFNWSGPFTARGAARRTRRRSCYWTGLTLDTRRTYMWIFLCVFSSADAKTAETFRNEDPWWLREGMTMIKKETTMKYKKNHWGRPDEGTFFVKHTCFIFYFFAPGTCMPNPAHLWIYSRSFRVNPISQSVPLQSLLFLTPPLNLPPIEEMPKEEAPVFIELTILDLRRTSFCFTSFENAPKTP